MKLAIILAAITSSFLSSSSLGFSVSSSAPKPDNTHDKNTSCVAALEAQKHIQQNSGKKVVGKCSTLVASRTEPLQTADDDYRKLSTVPQE